MGDLWDSDASTAASDNTQRDGARRVVAEPPINRTEREPLLHPRRLPDASQQARSSSTRLRCGAAAGGQRCRLAAQGQRDSSKKDLPMTATKWLLSLMVPAALAVSLGACNQTGGGTQPGIVNTSATASTSGDSGRVVAIREVAVRGGSSGMSNGTMVGGGLGAAGGTAIGAATTNSRRRRAWSVALLGAVGGAIAGTAIERRRRRASAASRSRCRRTTGRRWSSRRPTTAMCKWATASGSSRVATAWPSAVRDTGYRRDILETAMDAPTLITSRRQTRAPAGARASSPLSPALPAIIPAAPTVSASASCGATRRRQAATRQPRRLVDAGLEVDAPAPPRPTRPCRDCRARPRPGCCCSASLP